MDDLDALIGKNLARLRGDRSQADLAKEMKEHGFKWSQATVWSIEKGERPLRLSEARRLSEILGIRSIIGPSAFLANDWEAQLRSALDPVTKAYKAMEEAISEFLKAQDHLAHTSDLVSEKSPPAENPSYLWGTVHRWLTEHSPSESAAHLEKVHQTESTEDLRDEMALYGVRSVRQLVEARDAAAQRDGYKDHETKYSQNMKMGGNYSGTSFGVIEEDNGEHPEEA